MFGAFVEFAGSCAVKSANVTCVFYYHHLHAETNTETRHVVFSRILARRYHAFGCSSSESARNNNSVRIAENLFCRIVRYRLAIYPRYIDFNVNRITAASERFGYRQICVVQRHILTDKGNLYFRFYVFSSFYKRLPVA